MVIEVRVDNRQSSSGESPHILLERWTLTWYRSGRTGLDAWIGTTDTEKMIMLMMRRVALSSRLTQVTSLHKRSSPSQYEICYRIAPGPSTLHFGAADKTREVIFHGHIGHTAWHINNNASLAFTLNYRVNSWTPRSQPHLISAIPIIDNYQGGASSSHHSLSPSPLNTAPIASNAPRSGHYQSLSHGYGANPLAGQAHSLGNPPSHLANMVKSPSNPRVAQSPTGTSHSPLGPTRATSPGVPSGMSPAYAPFGAQPDDEYAAMPPQSPYRPMVPSGSHNNLYNPEPVGTAQYSASMPKPSSFDQYMATNRHGPSPSDLPSPRSYNQSPHHQSPQDRVPGSSPPGTDSRPVRMRSSSSSASLIAAGASTSISPYRMDSSIMTKSPPSQPVGLPLDMMGPPARTPSSSRVGPPIAFGNQPITTALATAGSRSSGVIQPFISSGLGNSASLVGSNPSPGTPLIDSATGDRTGSLSNLRHSLHLFQSLSHLPLPPGLVAELEAIAIRPLLQFEPKPYVDNLMGELRAFVLPADAPKR